MRILLVAFLLWPLAAQAKKPVAHAASSCNGQVGSAIPRDHNYYLTSFGCWVDAGGHRHGDAGDNCIPACQAKVCRRGEAGPDCERRINYYTADSTRFGCGTKVKITARGKSVVALVIDAGPACFVENNAGKPVVDASAPVSNYLFGNTSGWADRRAIKVEKVSAKTPLGPVKKK